MRRSCLPIPGLVFFRSSRGCDPGVWLGWRRGHRVRPSHARPIGGGGGGKEAPSAQRSATRRVLRHSRAEHVRAFCTVRARQGQQEAGNPARWRCGNCLLCAKPPLCRRARPGSPLQPLVPPGPAAFLPPLRGALAGPLPRLSARRLQGRSPPAAPSPWTAPARLLTRLAFRRFPTPAWRVGTEGDPPDGGI